MYSYVPTFEANMSTRVQCMCADGCEGAEDKMLIERDVRETLRVSLDSAFK